MMRQVRSAVAANDDRAIIAFQLQLNLQCYTQHPADILHDTGGVLCCIA